MPLPPVTTGLAFVYQADAITAVDGDTVTSWIDQSAAGNDAVGSGTPVFHTAQTPNGGPAVHFAANGSFTLPDTVFTAGGTATGVDLFIVLRAPLAVSDNPALWHFGGGDRTYYTFTDGNIYDGAFTATRFSFPAVTANLWHVYHVQHDGTTWTARIDNTIAHQSATALVVPTSGLAIGIDGYTWSGDIAEIVCYRRALTGTERDDVYTYLLDRHLSTAVHTSAPPIDATVDLHVAPRTDAPPIDATVDPTTQQLTDAPPIDVIADLGVAAQLKITDAPPIEAVAGFPQTPRQLRVRRQLFDPADAAILPSLRPVFTVAATLLAGRLYTLGVDIEYDTDPGFTAPVQLHQDVRFTLGRNTIRIPATGDLSEDTYSWRARLVLDGVAMAWTAARRFTIDTTAGGHTVALTWRVTTADTSAHLWYTQPAAAFPGEQATVVGQGFPDAGTVTIGGVEATIQSWTHVPATPAADTDARTIDPDTGIHPSDPGTVDTEHDEIVITVPAVTPPGGPLTVHAS